MTELNPAQQAVAAGLLDLRGGAPRVDGATIERITRGFTERTQWAVDALDEAGQTLAVTKRSVSNVLDCETRWRDDLSFAWSVPTAIGSVTHRAAELMMVGRLDGPLEHAVAGAIALMIDESQSFAAFVDESSQPQLAAIRAGALAHVASLVEGFPRLPARVQPRTEQSFKAWIGGRTVELTARPDLALGRPVGTDARSLLVDLKTGTPHQSHVDDLRFYALVFMLRWGAPPWRIASYYAPDGTWTAEDVDADVLEAAARRTSDAILRMAEIVASNRPPGLTPGPSCRWCALRETCDGAKQWAIGVEDDAN